MTNAACAGTMQQKALTDVINIIRGPAMLGCGKIGDIFNLTPHTLRYDWMEAMPETASPSHFIF